ncbi:hypothetical protein SASPL_105591 [Salvia splendens]|uniref:C2 NT-type domain-containing protein n=1 Tax=Salvia splendens TaxID=180675 RepID=A0A8X8YNW4_SALSN|nr:putative uncharacterized protein MYH16 isoform X2 [Salvia splendens]KAG6433972.1 hypothetical protein SASPL_105591 [Salvia splendens]
MLKLQRPANRSSKQKEGFHFKFSNFQALQVPKGWDRLFLSLLSAETGKTIAKLGKALVKNGSCHWSNTVTESIYISKYDSSKSYEECLLKIIVSTGSTRSANTLGEAIINMAQHTTSRASAAAVSQPLQKCSYGTILQVKIQRLNLPRSKIRDEGSKSSDSQEKVEDVDHHVGLGRKSRRSDESSDSINKHTREDPATTSRPLQLDSEEASESATVVINSISSMEGSYERENSFGERSDEYRSHERRGRGSNGGDLLPEFYSIDDDVGGETPSNQSPMYLRENFHNEASVSRWSMPNVGSSRNLLEAAEDTIEELRAEAKMWERNARKLMIDLDISRKEFSNLSKKQVEWGVELSAAYAEQDCLRRQLEKAMEDMQQLAKNEEAPIIQSRSFQKELESEIKYQQDLNDDLCQQLKQSQESNIELVSVLQELEETIEQQRIEIENLSSLKLNFVDLQNSLDKSSEEKRTLSLQLEQLWESERNLKSEIQLLDEALQDKNDELEKERESHREVLSQVEAEYNRKMLAKEEENASLEGKLSDYIKDKELKGNAESDLDLIREIESLKEKVRELEKDCTELTDENLDLLFKLKDSNKTDIRKCSSFGSVTSEHPTSCPSEESEVSDPRYQVSNLEGEIGEEVSVEVQLSGLESSQHFAEILEQMDKAFHLLTKPWYGRSENGGDYLHGLVISDKVNTTRMSVESIHSLLLELNELLETRISESAEILKNHEAEINKRDVIISEARKKMEESILKVEELGKMKAKSEENNANLMRELEQKKSEIGYMEADLLSKRKETDFLLHRRQELESEVSKLQQETSRLEQDLEVAVRERKISSECMENLQSEVTALRDAVSSHVSANTDLEINIKQLEIRSHELQNSLSELLEENTWLQACISDQEVQVHQLRDEKLVFLQKIEDYKSSLTSLQDEIRESKDEMDVQILDLKQKSEDIRKQWLGAQEECVYLREENNTLQASAASSAAETIDLQNLNSELKRENQKLHEKCLELVDQLSEMEKSLADCTKKVESMQDHLASVQEDFVVRESHLKSELDALVKEKSYQKEKLAEEESLQQLLLEKTTEFQSLQKEVESLSKQLSDACEERERISTEASSLLAEKAELQYSLREAHQEAKSAKNKLNAALQESEFKVEELTNQLAASNQRLDRLTTDYDRNLKLVANYRKIEEKLKTELNDIELKHTISEYECQQLTREMSSLKIQLQIMYELEDEVSVLKSELRESKVDKGNLEAALHTISGNYEELKTEKISLSEKITYFEDAMSELEECKRSKSCLEEKLLQMEKDLSEKEIISIQNEDLKHEVTEVKRLKVQFQQKMYRLEVEKDECLKKVQALEDNLRLMEEKSKEGAHNLDFNDEDPLAVSVDSTTKRQMVENETAERQKKNGGRDKYERTKSSLETELRDLKQRYLEMSLKYAEVEGEREDLVMKLRATRTGNRWFS